MKSLWSKLIIGISIGALFLFLTLRQVDFRNVWAYIQHAQWSLILIAAVIYSLAFFLRSIRWHYLLAPVTAVSSYRLFSYLILGFFMNNLLPLRLGELIRAHVTGLRTNTPRSSVLATVVVERLFDGTTYIILFLFTVLFLPFPEWVKRSLTVGSIIFALMFAVLIMVAHQKDKSVRLATRLPLPEKIKNVVLRILANFAGGLSVFTRAGDLVVILLLSVCVWGIEAAVFYILGYAFHLPLSYFQCLLVMIIIGIGAIIPTAPGYVGTVEFLGVTSLVFIGIDKNPAFAYIVTLHLLQLLTIFAWGIRSLFTEGISVRELYRIK